METERFEIRIDTENKQFLKKQENASELIRELLTQYRLGGDTLYKKKIHIEKQLQETKNKVVDLEIELSQIKKEIEDMELQKLIRPEGYEESIERLLHMPLVSLDDLNYQASLLNVDISLYKKWLFDDGFFDRRLR